MARHYLGGHALVRLSPAAGGLARRDLLARPQTGTVAGAVVVQGQERLCPKGTPGGEATKQARRLGRLRLLLEAELKEFEARAAVAPTEPASKAAKKRHRQLADSIARTRRSLAAVEAKLTVLGQPERKG
jgi:hypothetical protein